ncbi:MAG: cobalamin-dependent protein [Desulfobacterales bacterium]|nr:cobalamin-dependent protein [Desulfobacterales bacterium]
MTRNMVGFSATTSGFLDGWEMAAAIKQARPGVVTVFGGVHVSALGGALLERFAHIDYLCPGEGEATLTELAAGEDPARIDGLIRRVGEEIVVNAPRAPLAGPRRAALSRLRKAGRVSPGLQPAAVQLHPSSRRHDDHQPGLHLPVLLLRPLGVQAGVPLELRRPTSTTTCATSGRASGSATSTSTTISSPPNRPRIAELCGMLTRKPLGMQFNCAVRVGQTDRRAPAPCSRRRDA